MAGINVISEVSARLDAMSADLKAEIATQLSALQSELAQAKSELTMEISGLQTEVADVRADLKTEVSGIRTDLKNAGTGIRADLKNEFAALRADLRAQEERNEARHQSLVLQIRSLRWMMGLVIAMFAAVIVLFVQRLGGIPAVAPSEPGTGSRLPAAVGELSHSSQSRSLANRGK